MHKGCPLWLLIVDYHIADISQAVFDGQFLWAYDVAENRSLSLNNGNGNQRKGNILYLNKIAESELRSFAVEYEPGELL